MAPTTQKGRRQRTEEMILEAALDVFSTYGLKGATLDQIADRAGMSKPNLLYYFRGKDDIYRHLMGDLLQTWLDPMREIDPGGDPRDEILRYVRRKLAMSRDFPRESRLFATEIIAGAPLLEPFLREELHPLVQDTVALIQGWIGAGRIAPVDPIHLIFSIWALTQHYADFATQVEIVSGDADPLEGAGRFLDQLFGALLTQGQQ